jgi:hypothetical protein
MRPVQSSHEYSPGVETEITMSRTNGIPQVYVSLYIPREDNRYIDQRHQMIGGYPLGCPSARVTDYYLFIFRSSGILHPAGEYIVDITNKHGHS